MAKAGLKVRLAQIDTGGRRGDLLFGKAEAKKILAADLAEIERLQEVLYAQAKRALLVVLQGMDASGKDGTIRAVFGPIDPLGITAISFKKPTEHELAHDFLWRVHKWVPPLRMIGIFNRSHYEDVLPARVHALVPPERIDQRYGQIDAFERHLAENDVTIVKFFLHISRKEQNKRLQARLEDPSKRWKFSPSDLVERKYWNEYREAYEVAIERCSAAWAPWFIIPADRKWYRNALVARIVRATLEAMHLEYPRDIPGLRKLRFK